MAETEKLTVDPAVSAALKSACPNQLVPPHAFAAADPVAETPAPLVRPTTVTFALLVVGAKGEAPKFARPANSHDAISTGCAEASNRAPNEKAAKANDRQNFAAGRGFINGTGLGKIAQCSPPCNWFRLCDEIVEKQV